MVPFTTVVIIFNPNSTGDSPQMARDFAAGLAKQFPKLDIALQETKRAGHAEELAYTAAQKYQAKGLIVSVSGDGGYHEVVNGVMRAVHEGAKAPFCAVMPGGNANDHFSSVYDRPLLEALDDAQSTTLDLIQVSWAGKRRYAHSYAGLGITPLVAIELNKHSLSAAKELWLSLRTFWKFRPFTLAIDGKRQSFDSIIMANITTMAKHLTMDEDSSPRDGKFEVVQWPHGHKLQLLRRLALAAFSKGTVQTKTDELVFTTVTAMPMQLDGEIVKLPAETDVTIASDKQVLKTFR